jgi:hypothetical protein
VEIAKLGKTGGQHVLAADGHIAARRSLSRGKRVTCQQVNCKRACVNDFDGAMPRNALNLPAFEPVSAWHPAPPMGWPYH